MAIAPSNIDRALATRTRAIEEDNWAVLQVMSETSFSVQLASPLGVVPYISPTAIGFLNDCKIEFIDGVLGGVEQGGKPTPIGRFISIIQSVSSQLSSEGPVTIITLFDPFPYPPNPGDRFIIFRRPIPTPPLPVSGSVTASQGSPGSTPWPVNVENFPSTQQVTGSVTASQGAPGSSPWPVNVENFPSTQQVSGSVTATQGTVPWSTDLGVGFSRLGGGGTFTVGSSKTTVTFSKTAKQVYLQNLLSSQSPVSVTGDEEPTPGSDALVLQPGDAIGIAWETAHIYAVSTGSATLQVQAWG